MRERKEFKDDIRTFFQRDSKFKKDCISLTERRSWVYLWRKS